MKDGQAFRSPKSFRDHHHKKKHVFNAVEDPKKISDLMFIDVPTPAGNDQFDTLQKTDDDIRGLEKSNTQDKMFKTLQGDECSQSFEKPFIFFAYGGNYPERIKEALARRGNWQEVRPYLVMPFS